MWWLQQEPHIQKIHGRVSLQISRHQTQCPSGSVHPWRACTRGHSPWDHRVIEEEGHYHPHPCLNGQENKVSVCRRRSSTGKVSCPSTGLVGLLRQWSRGGERFAWFWEWGARQVCRCTFYVLNQENPGRNPAGSSHAYFYLYVKEDLCSMWNRVQISSPWNYLV